MTKASGRTIGSGRLGRAASALAIASMCCGGAAAHGQATDATRPGVAGALATAAALAGETTRAVEDGTPSAPGPLGSGHSEPVPRRGVEESALLSAYRGEPFDDPPESLAVAQAMARVRATPAPPAEVFAVVTVTDRHTGERRFLTRGTPSPELAAALTDSSRAPRGVAYAELEDGVADDDVEVVTRSVQQRPARPHRRRDDDREEEKKLKRRNRGGGLHWRIDGDLRARILGGAISLASDEDVPVTIRLKRVPRLSLPKVHATVADGLLWVGLDVEAARQQAIIDRKRAMAALQQRVVDQIQARGGSVRYASWAAGSVAATVPASALRALASQRDVLLLEYRAPLHEDAVPADSYQGDDWFVATDSENFDLFHDGGGAGPSGRHTSITSDVLIAQSEECIDDANPGYLDWAGGPSRLTLEECDGSACTSANYFTCTDKAHGNGVAGEMVADFMAGQDPAVDATDGRLITGTCPECHLLFIQDRDLDDREAAMDRACEEEADIFQSSISSGISCDGHGSLDASVEALADCDVAIVQSASNDGSTSGTCTVNHPADHPWTIAVGGMFSKDPCNVASAYYTADCGYSTAASKGGAGYNGITTDTASLVDITAPYNTGGVMTAGTANPVVPKNGGGTSYSSPLTAGLLAELMDWWGTHMSEAIFFENRARNVILLMGDRSVDAAGTSRALNFYDDFWGAGRIGLVPWDDKATWGVFRGSSTLGPGDSWRFTMSVPTGATFLKASVWHDGTDYMNQPILSLELDPVGCTTPTKSVTRRDSKVMLVYTPTSTPLAGCSEVDVTVTNVVETSLGAGVERRFHVAAYSDVEDERHF